MFFTAGVDKLSLHFVPCVPSSVQSIPLHSVLPEHAVWQAARVVGPAFGRVLRTFVFAQKIQRTQPVPTQLRYIIKHFRRKARALRDGDVILFVCSFVCSSGANAYWSGTGLTAQQPNSAGCKDRPQQWWATQASGGEGEADQVGQLA